MLVNVQKPSLLRGTFTPVLPQARRFPIPTGRACRSPRSDLDACTPKITTTRATVRLHSTAASEHSHKTEDPSTMTINYGGITNHSADASKTPKKGKDGVRDAGPLSDSIWSTSNAHRGARVDRSLENSGFLSSGQHDSSDKLTNRSADHTVNDRKPTPATPAVHHIMSGGSNQPSIDKTPSTVGGEIRPDVVKQEPLAATSTRQDKTTHKAKVVVAEKKTPTKKAKTKAKPKPKPKPKAEKQKRQYPPNPSEIRAAEIEHDRFIDVYNYLACYGLVPRIIISHSGRKEHTFRITISLPEWNIESVASSVSVRPIMAEARAMSDFKTKAESYLANNDPLRHKDHVITTENAKQFLDYCRHAYPLMDTIVENKFTAPLEPRWLAQTFVNSTPVGHKIVRRHQQQAQNIAHLTAALSIAKNEPTLLEDFARKTVVSQEIPPLAPTVYSPVEYHSELVMMETLRSLTKAGLTTAREEITPEVEYDHVRHFRRERIRLEEHAAKRRNEDLTQRLNALLADASRTDMLRKLPMNAYRSEVYDMISNSIFSIVVGATGSGKTTQVPQILLDEAIQRGEGIHCNIVCTQPRRIAATSVARQVAAQRNEDVGDTVGYHVRFDANHPRPGGSILYCTAGIILEQLKHSPDDVMDNVSHIILDEVHERDMIVDFLLISLRSIVRARMDAGRPVPRIVLMSATLDVDLFTDYLSLPGLPCPSIDVPGRTFPVKQYFLEDVLQGLQRTFPGKLYELLNDPVDRQTSSDLKKYIGSESALAPADDSELREWVKPVTVVDWKKRPAEIEDPSVVDTPNEQIEAIVPLSLVTATIAHICKISTSGAILVFLPGFEEIVKTDNSLRRPAYGLNFEDPAKFEIHVLHSIVTKEEQWAAFAPVPEGCRKIILSTNIAETSVTIPDVSYVVDTGKSREKQYDQMKCISQLQTVWASKSNVKQRAGRAGRVQDGNYVALYSKNRHQELKPMVVPELLRSDLQETCLAVKAQRFQEPAAHFLSQAIEPPTPAAVQAAVAKLKSLDAFTPDEKLTDLGRILANMPVHPSLGKMIVLGIIFRCLDPMLLIAALSNERSIFIKSIDGRSRAKEARQAFAGYGSDHISFLKAFDEMRRRRDSHGFDSLRNYARSNFLRMESFRHIERTAFQIETSLIASGLIPKRAARGGHAGGPQMNAAGIGGPDLNVNSQNYALIRALLVSGLRPNLVAKTVGSLFRSPTEDKAIVQPSSFNALKRNTKEGYARGTLFTFTHLAKRPDNDVLFICESTRVSPLVAMLFGGRLSLKGNTLTMDDWLPFSIRSDDSIQTARIILELRKALDRLLMTAFRSLTSHREDPNQPFLADIPLVDQCSRHLSELLEIENENEQNKEDVRAMRSQG